MAFALLATPKKLLSPLSSRALPSVEYSINTSLIMSLKRKGMKSAVRWLCRYGEEALKPQIVENLWQKPKVSKRVAAGLRKQALVEGSYGSFDPETGKGWDSKWDELRQTGTMQLRPPKLTKRQRTREARASKIETLLEGMDEKIDNHYKKMREKKTKVRSFENWYKSLTAVGKKG